MSVCVVLLKRALHSCESTAPISVISPLSLSLWVSAEKNIAIVTFSAQIEALRYTRRLKREEKFAQVPTSVCGIVQNEGSVPLIRPVTASV